MVVEQRLHDIWQSHDRDVEAVGFCRHGRAAHYLSRRVIAAHGVDRYSHLRSSLDIEVPDALGMRLDEFLARLDIGSHQLLECLVDRGDVFDRHL